MTTGASLIDYIDIIEENISNSLLGIVEYEIGENIVAVCDSCSL